VRFAMEDPRASGKLLNRGGPMGFSAQSGQKIRFGEFEIDPSTRELWTNGRRLTLQEQPFQILVALLERPGQLIPRDELTKRLWPSDTFVDFEHSLNKAVNRLREALDDSAERPRLIETLPRRGYRFIGRLEPVASQQSETSTTVSSFSAPQSAAKHPSSRYSVLRFGIILALACLLATWFSMRRRDAKSPEADFQRLSFGRGTILSARFAPDGKSVIYAAAWDGKPVQLFWTSANSPESRPFGVEADILAISRSGEMAVLQNQHYGIIASQGTLALMSLTGSAPRKLIDNVQDADWSPDGSKLAVTHYVGGRCDLEFPIGKVLYETTGGAWLSRPRVSPGGDQIAFLEHPIGGDDSGFLAVIDTLGRKKTVSRAFGGIQGMAWDPGGEAIWLSGYEPARRAVRALFKVTLAGQQYLIRRESGNLSLLDVSRNRQLLLTRDSIRGEVFGRIHPESKERELSWFDNSYAVDLSPDGGAIVLSVQGESSTIGYDVYLRKTDGSPAVRLGAGVPRQLSLDGKWVLTTDPIGARPTSTSQLFLVPTGTGQSRSLTNDSISHYFATLMPDGKRFLFEGYEAGHARRNWIQSLSGGKPVPITPEGTVGKQVSPDGKWVVALDSERRSWLYPTTGGPPKALSGIEPAEDPIRWSGDGKSLFVVDNIIPASVHRVEVLTGRRHLVYTLVPSDAAGLWNIWPILITPDGESYVYSDYRILSDLYLAEELK
jgi:DNA-binding winged helix-turn-helix (wHTH) protein/Tol biopolymer transport system component